MSEKKTRGQRRTVQRCVHATEIDQQTDHRHANSRRLIILQLVLENLARLATPRHCVDVDVCEIHILLTIGVPREDRRLVFKDKLEELVLDIFAPQRDAILLLEMSDLVARVNRANRAVCLASRTDRRAGGHALGLVVRSFGHGEGFVYRGIFDFGHLG